MPLKILICWSSWGFPVLCVHESRQKLSVAFLNGNVHLWLSPALRGRADPTRQRSGTGQTSLLLRGFQQGWEVAAEPEGGRRESGVTVLWWRPSWEVEGSARVNPAADVSLLEMRNLRNRWL